MEYVEDERRGEKRWVGGEQRLVADEADW